jgi:glycosyltransferase involved in cell wall biosynthesis
MIVKNEEFFIDRCMRAAAPYVDEIVIVDTGSSDQTRAIAAQYADRVIDFQWIEDFSAARNAALELATSEWVLVLDADEVIAEQGYAQLRSELSTTQAQAFSMLVRNYTHLPQGVGWQAVTDADPYAKDYTGFLTNEVVRLFRNHLGLAFSGRIHEIVDPRRYPDLNWSFCDVPIHHYMDEDPSKRRNQRQMRYLQLMEQELRTNPDGRLYATAGATAMYHGGSLTKAAEYFSGAIELGYDVNKNREALAEAHYRNGELEQAWSQYQQLWRDNYRTPSLCLNYANLAVKRGEVGWALELLGCCLELGGLGEEVNLQIKRNIAHLRSRL